MHIVLMRFAATILLFALTGCVSALIYQGDGRLVDRGILTYETVEGRYTLSLETVSFSKSGEYSYRMANLPGDYFTVGFRINDHIEIASKARTDIRVRLVNDRNEEVIDVRAELKDWTLSYPVHNGYPVYAYMRGEEHAQSRGTKSATETTLDTERAACGWGTYFRARKWSRYTLIVSIRAAAESPVKEAKLQLKDTVPVRCE